MGETVLKISVYQIKQLTTAHEAIASCAKHALSIYDELEIKMLII